MKTKCSYVMMVLLWTLQIASGQNANPNQNSYAKLRTDTSAKTIFDIGNVAKGDTAPHVNFPEVNIITFKSNEEWMEYYRCRERILKVLPYVRIAKQLYV